MYVIEFDNYLKSKPQAKQKSMYIRSFNDIITSSCNTYTMLCSHLQNAPPLAEASSSSLALICLPLVCLPLFRAN